MGRFNFNNNLTGEWYLKFVWDELILTSALLYLNNEDHDLRSQRM